MSGWTAGQGAPSGPYAPKFLPDAQRGPFGVALKAFREARRLSQIRLAERAGYDHSYVSRLESGARVPTRVAVDRLAHALDGGDDDRDRLMTAAGFVVTNGQQATLDREPALVAAVALLGDAAVPIDLRDGFREQLFTLTSVYRRAATADEEVRP